jgi:hypothetical protein
MLTAANAILPAAVQTIALVTIGEVVLTSISSKRSPYIVDVHVPLSSSLYPLLQSFHIK